MRRIIGSPQKVYKHCTCCIGTNATCETCGLDYKVWDHKNCLKYRRTADSEPINFCSEACYEVYKKKMNF